MALSIKGMPDCCGHWYIHGFPPRPYSVRLVESFGEGGEKWIATEVRDGESKENATAAWTRRLSAAKNWLPTVKKGLDKFVHDYVQQRKNGIVSLVVNSKQNGWYESTILEAGFTLATKGKSHTGNMLYLYTITHDDWAEKQAVNKKPAKKVKSTFEQMRG